MTDPAPGLSVSVVIPAYNAESVIGTGLQSLLAQHQRPDRYEVIVVDDCSTDRTAEIVQSLVGQAAASGIRLTLLRQDRNGGPARARNRGAEAATGSILIFTDSDCEPTAGWLSQMLAPFADPGVAAVKGAYLTRQRSLGARFAQAEFDERYRMLRRATTVDVVFSYSAAFRTDVFRALNGFDTRFPVADNEDTDLSWRLTEAGYKAVFASDATLYHRHPPDLYTYFRKKVSRGYWRVIVYRRFPGKAIKDSYTPQSLKLQILLAWSIVLMLGLGLLIPGAWLVAAGLALAFLLSTLPFALGAWQSDPLIAALSPLLLLGRALALGWGILRAIPRALRPDPLAADTPTRRA